MKSVVLWNVPYGNGDYKERVTVLKALDTTVRVTLGMF